MDAILKKIVKFILKMGLLFLRKIFSVIFTVLFTFFIISILILSISEGFNEEKVFIKKNTYLIMEFENGLGLGTKKNIFDLFMKKDYDFYSILKGIEEAAEDNKINGIILNLDKFNISTVYMDELEEKIEYFKEKGKKVIAFSSNYNNSNYRMALCADEIIMPPSASTNFHLTAYYTALPYFRTISNKVGVKYNVISIGDYKSFGENYVRDEISPELKSELERVLDIKYENLKKKISEKREIEKSVIDSQFENGELVLLSAIEAKEKNYIDRMVYYEDEFKKKNTNSFYKYLDIKEKEKKNEIKKENNIAVIYMNGEIITRDIKDKGFAREDYISPYSFSKNFEKAIEDPKVNGIILRIDSPGGSAFASEIISNTIEKASEKKDIYVSMGAVAASGGYYIASNGQKIFVEEETITGSIGVVSLIPNFYDLSQKLGIGVSVVSRGKYAGIYDLTKETSPEEIELIRLKMDKIYMEFKSRVSKGRNLTMESVEEIAQGRIWIGEEAVETGLADGIGGLDYTIKRMAKDLGIEDYGVISYDKKPAFMDMLKKGELSKVYSLLKSDKTIYSLLKNEYRFLMYGNKPLTLMPYNID